VRTTIEITPEHRAKLLDLAARRGQRGLSAVLSEAIEAYLADHQKRDVQQAARKLMGAISPKDAQQLRRDTFALRKRRRSSSLLTRNNKHFARVRGLRLAD